MKGRRLLSQHTKLLCASLSTKSSTTRPIISTWSGPVPLEWKKPKQVKVSYQEEFFVPSTSPNVLSDGRRLCELNSLLNSISADREPLHILDSVKKVQAQKIDGHDRPSSLCSRVSYGTVAPCSLIKEIQGLSKSIPVKAHLYGPRELIRQNDNRNSKGQVGHEKQSVACTKPEVRFPKTDYVSLTPGWTW